MNSPIRKLFFAASLLALFSIAPSLKADQTYQLTLTSAGNGNNAYGIYVGPYVGTINGGASTQIICDDFTDESFVGETWQATATNLGTGNLGSTGTTMFQNASNYDAAAYLALELLGTTNSTLQIEYQYAIWDLMNPGGVSADSDIPASFLAAIQPLITSAEANDASISNMLADFTLYTPIAGSGMCGSTACSPSTPQEFLVYTPEPSTLLLLGLGLGCLGFLALRRKKTHGTVLAV